MYLCEISIHNYDALARYQTDGRKLFSFNSTTEIENKTQK